MKEPPGDTRSDGSFIVYEMETGQKWAKKHAKILKNTKKSARQFYQNHRADLVRIFITKLIVFDIIHTYSKRA